MPGSALFRDAYIAAMVAKSVGTRANCEHHTSSTHTSSDVVGEIDQRTCHYYFYTGH
jgi:hypothetical protein